MFILHKKEVFMYMKFYVYYLKEEYSEKTLTELKRLRNPLENMCALTGIICFIDLNSLGQSLKCTLSFSSKKTHCPLSSLSLKKCEKR